VACKLFGISQNFLKKLVTEEIRSHQRARILRVSLRVGQPRLSVRKWDWVRLVFRRAPEEDALERPSGWVDMPSAKSWFLKATERGRATGGGHLFNHAAIDFVEQAETIGILKRGTW
jgi:hypothetical protein